MAHIYNIKTKVTTECLNRDVIKVCKKNPLDYLINDNLDELKEEIKKLEPTVPAVEKNVPLSKLKLEDLKALAVELGLECDGLNCEELRKIIRDKQG